MALLQEIDCVLAKCFCLSVDGIELVPVDLAVCLVCFPIVIEVLPCVELPIFWHQIPDIVGITWQILVVVRARVGSIASPVECCGAIARILEHCGGCQLGLIVDVEVPSQHTSWLQSLRYAGIALLATLITPVAIIIMRVGKPVGFFRCSSL